MKRVALCVTCLVDQAMPAIGVATVQLLRRAGFEVVFPPEQSCCGQPFFNSGFRGAAARLAKRTIEIFEEYEWVVLPSGSCATMICHEYALLLAGEADWQKRAEQLAERCFELSVFLVRVAGWQPERVEARGVVSYHDSCHACRLLGVRGEPRQLLRAAGYEVVEMVEADRCCGFGGLFSVRMPALSNAITQEKIRQALATSAEVLVTIDPGCLQQIQGLAEKRVQVKHLAEML